MNGYIPGLYIMKACNLFDVAGHVGFTLGNEYHIHKNGNFFDDNRNTRAAEGFSWRKVKGYEYPEAEVRLVEVKGAFTEKASAGDLDGAASDGVDTPKIKVVYHDEEIVSQADFNKAMQRVAAATNIPESRLNPSHLKDNPTSEPGVSFIQQVNLDDHKHVSQPEAKVTGPAYEEPAPVDFHELPETNPKKARGDAKAPYVFCPEVPVIYMNAVMAGGAHKYGPYNFRDTKVDALTYLGGMRRHIALWADGQDKDKESGIHHLAHVMSNCAILIDAELNGMLVDNRPITGLVDDVMKQMAKLHARYEKKNKAHDA